MRTAVAALVFALSCSIGHGAGKESPEATETTIDLRLIQVLLEEQIKLNDGKLDGPERPVTIREFSKSLSREIARRMVFKDGWGNEFMVVGDHEFFLISSAGEDRVHDLMYLVGKGAEATEGLIIEHVMGDDILLLVGEGVIEGVHRGSVSALDRQKRSMADLRSIGTSIESFSIDNNVYPLQDRDLLPVELIRDSLSPVYIRTLPLVDGWGNEFLMWGTEAEYVIMSLGADELPDQYYGFASGYTATFPFKGAFTDPDGDIIFSNGQFVQWPKEMQQ